MKIETFSQAPEALAVVAPQPIVGVPMMDETEARGIVRRINARIEDARRDLLELEDREGWKALGYRSWGACVKAEFGNSRTALYRQLETAEIEREIFGDSRIGTLPASQAAAVKHLPTEDKRAAFQRADQLAGDGPRTAKHIAQAAAEIAPPGWLCVACNRRITDMRAPETRICTSCAMDRNYARQTEDVIANAPAPHADGARRRAIGLLSQLAPLMELLRPKNQEGMSRAITDLNECQEGTEARHWIAVGWAMLENENH